MKKVIVLLVGLIMVACAAPPKPTPIVPLVDIKPIEYIHWETDLAWAVTRSYNENKLLMIYFYSPHCEWCDSMTSGNGVFRLDSERIIISKNFVTLKVNTEESEFAKKVEVDEVPTLVIISPSNSGVGEVLGVNVGYASPKVFDDFVARSEKKYNEMKLAKK